MKERILKTHHGQYELAEWNGTNESGYEPVCDKVLVLPDKVMEKTKGGILMPDVTGDQQQVAAVTGIVVAVGPQAFAYDSDRLVKWEGWRPQPGDRIAFQRYAGDEYPGLDGQTYRIMQDRSVGARVTLTPRAAASKAA
jgi:chaperonin GroES